MPESARRRDRVSCRALRSAVAAALLLTLGVLTLGASGCGYFLRSPGRPTPSLHYHWGPPEARASCLLVLVPGFLDDADTFERQGMIAELHGVAPTCDLVAASIHLYDYADESVVDRIHQDVVVEARDRGYERVWLVGVSMGALAAVLTARAHPGEIDGLVLISPYLGTPSFVARLEREIAGHGGLAEWARATPDGALQVARVLHDPRPAWRWLARYGARDEESADVLPPLWLGWGQEDRLAPAHRLLAREVALERTLVVDGGHDWRTWRRIVENAVAEIPIEGALGHRGAGGGERERGSAPVPPGLARRPTAAAW